jgi:DNA-binding CsgD family transcriptional regulator
MPSTTITIVVAEDDEEARRALFAAIAGHPGLRVVDVRTPAGEALPPAPPVPLTSREKEVLALVAGGHSNAQIGERLSLSSATVRNHVTTILAKLGVANRTQAAAWALRAGFPAVAAEVVAGDVATLAC